LHYIAKCHKITQGLILKGAKNMLEAGLIITAVGMLGVFVFLILLVLTMSFMSTIITKIFPEKKFLKVVKSRNLDDVEIAIAIAAVKHMGERG
jgi:sodium pump decarboxylase gamma subunit